MGNDGEVEKMRIVGEKEKKMLKRIEGIISDLIVVIIIEKNGERGKCEDDRRKIGKGIMKDMREEIERIIECIVEEEDKDNKEISKGKMSVDKVMRGRIKVKRIEGESGEII